MTLLMSICGPLAPKSTKLVDFTFEMFFVGRAKCNDTQTVNKVKRFDSAPIDDGF